MLFRSLLFSIILCTCAGAVQAQIIFLEDAGIVRVDVESVTTELGEWEKKQTLAGFIGDDYLEFTGANNFNTTGKSLLSYTIRITTTGTYLFRWHSRITVAGENTDYNDSWLRCPDASLFYAERNGSRVFPRGSGMTPLPEGSGNNNWFKAYQNRRDEWFWGVFTSDNDPHDIFMDFDTPGDYTIEISGRSMGHAIDRFVLVHSTASTAEAQNLGSPESERATTSVGNTFAGNLLLSPNPVINHLNLTVPANLPGGIYKFSIFDAAGRTVRKFDRRLNPNSTASISVDDLPAGAYVLILTAEGGSYRAKFVK